MLKRSHDGRDALALFVERATDTSLDYDGSENNFSLGPYSTVNVPIITGKTVVGIQYWF